MKQLYSKARGFIVGAKSMESFQKDFKMSEKKPEPRSVEFSDVGHKRAEKSRQIKCSSQNKLRWQFFFN